MSQTKKIGGAYTIAASGGTTIDSELTVTGNLTITGTTTTVSTTNTTVTDNIVVYNSGEAGAGVAGGSGKSGIEIDRGSVANAQLVFDESDDKFKISTDGGVSFTNLLVTSSTGLTEVVQDVSPQLGGDLDTNGFNIISARTNEDINVIPAGTGNLVINSAIRLNDQSAPSSVNNATLLYAATAAGGGTGVYFVDGSTSDELVSKSKAIVYGLIF
jgi:hypothetical protein